MINARVFQSMNIRRCNNLCLLNKDAYKKLRKTELMMGDLECRMSLIREEMRTIKETISHNTDNRKIKYKSSRAQDIVHKAQ